MFAILEARDRARPRTFSFFHQDLRLAIEDFKKDLNRPSILFSVNNKPARTRPPCNYGIYSRLHEYGPIRTVPTRECYACEGRLEKACDDEIELCHDCIAGVLPGYRYRGCLHCRHTQSTQRRSR